MGGRSELNENSLRPLYKRNENSLRPLYKRVNGTGMIVSQKRVNGTGMIVSQKNNLVSFFMMGVHVNISLWSEASVFSVVNKLLIFF